MLLHRLFAAALLVLALAMSAQSAVYRDYPQTLVQPDGAVIRCFASGNEFHHWLHDAQNYTIVQDGETGAFVFAALENGRLKPTRYVVGKVDPQAVGLTPGVNVPRGEVRARRQRMLAKPATSPAGMRSVGAINNLVIFVRFSDESSAIFPDSIARYDRMYNSQATGTNSLYMYYREVSYGKLGITSTFYPLAADSVLSYQDPHPRDYYRKYNAARNLIGYTSDDEAWEREDAMLVRAVNAVAAQVPSGLNIDADGDGFVDNVCFIVSGDVDGWADLLWPHMSWIGYKNVTIRGKRVGNFNLQLRNDLVDTQNMVYVLAHEMFHSLGAPDLYHYSGDSPDPVGTWDIMDYSVNPPVHTSAYMKWKYGGWLDSIPTISAPGTYALSTLRSSTNNCYRIPSPFSSREYFVVEYRKRGGTFEKSLPGEGLLVYRVNTNYTGNADGPPDELYLYRPGGTLTAEGTLNRAGMSANTGRVTLTDATSPSSFLTDGSPGGLVLTNVGPIGADTITFTIAPLQFPVITLDKRAIYFEPIGDASPRIDTAIVVRNTGFGPDSLTASVSPDSLQSDSAITVSPQSFTLAAGDSQRVAITIRPQLLRPAYYTPEVVITSTFAIGQKTFAATLDFEKTTGGIAGPDVFPTAYALQQNWPNPFNPATSLGYTVGVVSGQWSVVSNVRLAVYDLLGREVAVLVDERKEPGRYTVMWDASGCASGVYLYRLKAGETSVTKMMLLLR